MTAAEVKPGKLTLSGRAIMIIWGVALAQLAAPIGSAVYYLGTQVSYMSQAKHGQPIYIVGSTEPGDWWDRLPNHLGWVSSAVAPDWWVTARHDFRHVLIGLLVALLVGSLTVGVKPYRRRTPLQMVLSVPVAFLAAGAVATALIVFFNWAAPSVNGWGTSTGDPWVQNWVGTGALELTVIGIIAGIAAKLVLAPTFATVQLMSIEDRIADDRTPPRWYLPNYMTRYHRCKTIGTAGVSHGRYMGVVLVTAMPFLLALAIYGEWLLRLGPAAHVH